MQIKHLVIENFKSIKQIELIEPNPFTVFVGPNGSGKSNIFEALEFHVPNTDLVEKMRYFGGGDWLHHRLLNDTHLHYSFTLETDLFFQNKQGSYRTRKELDINPTLMEAGFLPTSKFDRETNAKNISRFVATFSRLFIGNSRLQRQNYIDDTKLTISASNLERVLKRLLNVSIIKQELIEWLELFIPGFQNIEVQSDGLSATDTLLIYEKEHNKPFIKQLISDGTYNILALLTAVYQSDEPQFLCIEEPENGLHPQVLMTLVDFFRQQCREKGHYIWLNTHSESIVRCLTTDEIVLVNKQNGATEIRQVKGRNIYDIPTDEAWLTGALGGGLPW